MSLRTVLRDAESQVSDCQDLIAAVLEGVLGLDYHDGEFEADTSQSLLVIYVTGRGSDLEEKIRRALKATGFDSAYVRWVADRHPVWDEVIRNDKS